MIVLVVGYVLALTRVLCITRRVSLFNPWLYKVVIMLFGVSPRLCSTGSRSRRSSTEGKVEDLDAWLHADVESDAAQSDNGTLIWPLFDYMQLTSVCVCVSHVCFIVFKVQKGSSIRELLRESRGGRID